MTTAYLVAIIALLVTMALSISRALLGPSIYDRILAVNSIGTKTVLFLALYGYFSGRPDFADLALLYALLNFLGTIAVLKFVERNFPSQQYMDQLAQEQEEQA